GVVHVRGDGGDDRDAAGLQQVPHGPGVDPDHVTDQADVDVLALDDGPAFAGLEQSGVLPGDAHGQWLAFVQAADQVALHLAGEHHAHHVHDLGGGHAQSAAELGVHAEAVQHGGDLRAAAVHDHRAQSGIAEEAHVVGEGAFQAGIDHGVAAELDDHHRSGELLEPGHGLHEYFG